jgi:flagellar hook assembly protein FlgD
MFCVGGVCYPPFQESIDLPVGGGTYASGAAEPIDIDFATLFDEGIGSMRVTITSVTDPMLSATATFTVTTGSVVAVDDVPARSLLSDAHAAPNPFNPRTEIRFTVGGEQARDAVVDIFDMSGRHVRRLVGHQLAPGQEHALVWDGQSDRGQRVATGTYLARVAVGASQESVKLSLVK